MSYIKEVELQGRTVRFEFNKFAKQANGSVMVSCGGTQVLVTVCAAEDAKEGQDFFPLTVDYVEKFYAAGKIPGGFLKRESRPSDKEVLNSRVIDRPLRPSFPKDYICDTFVTATVVSYEEGIYPAPLALTGASAALMVSDIPFNGPLAALRIGKKNSGELMLDPDEINPGLLDLSLAASETAILMVEAGADFLSEDDMLKAIETGHQWMKPLFAAQRQMQKDIGKPKRQLVSRDLDKDLLASIQSNYKTDIVNAFSIKDKMERQKAMSVIRKKALTELNPDKNSTMSVKVSSALEDFMSDLMRGMILTEGRRIDGRKLDEIRPISCETSVLKMAHGSSLFTRGETQALCVTTLGAADDAKRLDSLRRLEHQKRFMLHYNFPPFSVGEARPNRAPGRREIGHGALAERALERVIPPESDFAYTIRMVSEILESNGSSSMATVCGGSMALLQAGVPLKSSVSGIAMGLILDEVTGKYAILSDILGDEDHLGDMDFKVCGDEKGITALQMDIKVAGLTTEIMKSALSQAKAGRVHILNIMNKAISSPSELADSAPKVIEIKVRQDKIRDVIGSGGKTIKKITAETGVKMDINDSGLVTIMGPNLEAAKAAERMVLDVTSEPEIGQIYNGRVTKVVDFGCFVEIKPGVEGLVHISQLEDRRIENIHDHYSEGVEMPVKVIGVERGSGKIKLSRREAIMDQEGGGDTPESEGN